MIIADTEEGREVVRKLRELFEIPEYILDFQLNICQDDFITATVTYYPKALK